MPSDPHALQVTTHFITESCYYIALYCMSYIKKCLPDSHHSALLSSTTLATQHLKTEFGLKSAELISAHADWRNCMSVDKAPFHPAVQRKIKTNPTATKDTHKGKPSHMQWTVLWHKEREMILSATHTADFNITITHKTFFSSNVSVFKTFGTCLNCHI